MPLDNNMLTASEALRTARVELRSASDATSSGSADQKNQSYELALLSEETLDIYSRLLAIMHALNVPHA